MGLDNTFTSSPELWVSYLVNGLRDQARVMLFLDENYLWPYRHESGHAPWGW